jgi:hypothetical protein
VDRATKEILLAHIEEQRELANALYKAKVFGWTHILFRVHMLERQLAEIEAKD